MHTRIWPRILFDVIALILVFTVPWWATLVVGTIGVVLFSGYIEIIFLGALYDGLFGNVGISWYYHFVHTVIFTLPLVVIEYVKHRINV